MRVVLVTGGSGFIGSHLVARLLASGDWRVEVLTRDQSRAKKRLPDGVVLLSSLAEARRPDAVINLAGENLSAKRWTAGQKERLRESRLVMTRDLVDFMGRHEAPPEVFLSGSAVGFYGGQHGADILDERCPAGEEFQSRLCADWEAEAMRAHDEYDVRVCLLRTGIVLDANEGALPQMVTPTKFGLGGPFGHGRQYMPWIHVDDEVEAICHLLNNHQCTGAYNLTAPMPVTNAEFARTLADVLHRPAWARMPAPALKLMLGEMARLVLTGQRAVPTRLQQAGFNFKFSELEGALEDLVE